MARKAKVVEETKQKASVGEVHKSKVKQDRKSVVREEIIRAKQNIEEGYLDLSQLLSEAYHKEYYLEWGFDTFETYCKEELDVAYRKSMYLVDIWDKVKSLNLPKDKVAKLGWAKLKDLAAVLTSENSEEWLEKAEKMTSREVTEAVKIVRRKDTTGVSVPVVTTMTFKMGESEANIITEAIEEAKRLCSSDNATVALEMICQDWLLEKGVAPQMANLDDHLHFLEASFGVDISYKPKKQADEDSKKATTTVKKVAKKGAKHDSIDDLLKDEGPKEKDSEDQDLNALLGI